MHQKLSIVRLFFCLLGLALCSTPAHAINWTKLKTKKNETLYVDKSSITEQENLRKAWLKIVHKTPVKSTQEPDKKYNLSKVLWYFKCSEQKSATSQVAQYLDQTLVYSAGIDAKKAVFIDPVPETDVDIAMRFVCAYDRQAEAAKIAKRKADQKAKAEAKKKAEEDKKKAEEAAKLKAEEDKKKAEEAAQKQAAAEEAALEKNGKKGHGKKSKKQHKKDRKSAYKEKLKNKLNAKWKYRGRKGPKYWGDISHEYATCKTGFNQSPVNIKHTTEAKLEEIKGIYKYPATEIEYTGTTIEVRFEKGNMILLDDKPYRLKALHLRQPSEHKIKGKSLDLEMQFIHESKRGGKAILAVLFEKGKENRKLRKLWEQLPARKKRPHEIEKSASFSPKEIIPHNHRYYRINGSLTTPPCTEGVQWIIKKKILTVSEEQLNALKKILRTKNVRPVQKLHGRLVLE